LCIYNVQTYTQYHNSIDLASQYNYDEFFQYEMKLRKTFRYPPYVFLALVTVSHQNQVKVIQVTQKIVQQLQQTLSNQSTILGPTPSPITRMKDRYRYQCIIKYKDKHELRNDIRKILKQFREDMNKEDLMITVDMQPYQLM